MALTGGRDGPQLLGDAFHNDPDEARRSLQRLTGFTTRTIYPGHGPPLDGSIDDMVRGLT